MDGWVIFLPSSSLIFHPLNCKATTYGCLAILAAPKGLEQVDLLCFPRWHCCLQVNFNQGGRWIGSHSLWEKHRKTMKKTITPCLVPVISCYMCLISPGYPYRSSLCHVIARHAPTSQTRKTVYTKRSPVCPLPPRFTRQGGAAILDFPGFTGTCRYM